MKKLGSLFDGSGGFPLAGMINGICSVWASEIEPYPLRVTAERFPNMKQLGDVTKINGAEIEPVDVITFGSPCQDLSVAGAQKGIHEGERSNLFFEAIRIIKEMREHDRDSGRTGEHVRCRWAVWENVLGALGSNAGADFQAVLQAFCEVADPDVLIPEPPRGGWTRAGCIVGEGFSIAWRTYDAQFFGVPQRRKRIYLIADFGSERAGEILFERESMRGNPAQSREAREGTTADAEGSASRSCYAFHQQQDPIGGRISPCIGGQHQATVGVFIGGQGAKAGSIAYDESISPTLRATASGSNQTPDVVYAIEGNSVDRACCKNGKGYCENVSPTMNTQDRHAIAFDRRYIVRRLTPLECCRLQGFPDWWEDGAEGNDSARYKMWGNGIALPCAVDVLRRIAKAMEDTNGSQTD